MAKEKPDIELPSMLSFDRKLETSDALMFSGNWENIKADTIKKNYPRDDGSTFEKEMPAWTAIEITQRKNLATQSGHGINDENKKKPNPVSSGVDDANLPFDKDTLKVSFSLRVVGNLGKPFGCNSPEFQAEIQNRVEAFKDANGVKELAYRYAYNLANGRFLWRNRVGADEIRVCVQSSKDRDESLDFNAYDFSLKAFDKNRGHENLNKLAIIIEQGLLGDDENFVLIEIDAYIKIGNLQHVFPSQEMNIGEGKVLFKLNNCAAIHNVKIGNAIRTIDTWYPRYKDENLPIAIEPYGSVTQRKEAYRKNKKEGDLYSLMVDWVNGADISNEQQAYVVANLIRGGVFSKKNDNKG